MNIKMIIGALKSPKTPQHLKKALLKKYAKQLAGQVKDMSALSSTIRGSVGEVYSGNPKKKKLKIYDIILYKEDGRYFVVIPKKKYIGSFKTEAKMWLFLQPAIDMGMTIDSTLV